MSDKNLMLKAQIQVTEALKRAGWLWPVYGLLAFNSALLALVLMIEFELLYRTFAGIAGENNQYWSPGLMALTGVIMISAFHLLGKDRQGSLIARLVRGAAPLLLGLYLTGLGLLTSGVVSLDTISVLLSNSADLAIGALPDTAQEQPWLESFFRDVVNPVALTLFSLGIGGLAIVNLYVASELIESIQNYAKKIRDTKPDADRLKTDYAIVRHNQSRGRELQHDLGDLALLTEPRVIHETALQLTSIIQDALAPHKRACKRKEMAPAAGPLTLDDPVDFKLIERDLKKIDALDLKAITKILQSHTADEE